MGRREENKRKTEQSILEAGVRLLSGEDGASVTVQDIADAAGVSRATFFNYFESKQDIAVAFGDRQCGIAKACAQDLSADMPVVEKILLVMRTDHAAVKERLKNKVFARYVMTTMLGSEKMARIELRHWDELSRVYAGIIRQGVDDGQVSPKVDAALAGRMIVESYFATQLEVLFEGADDEDEDFSALVETRLNVIFAGLGLM